MDDQVWWHPWTEARSGGYHYRRAGGITTDLWLIRFDGSAEIYGLTVADAAGIPPLTKDTCSLGPFATEAEAKAVVGAYLKLTGGVTLE